MRKRMVLSIIMLAGTAASAIAQPAHSAAHAAAIVPEPSGILAMSTGIIGLVGYHIRRKPRGFGRN